MPDIARYPHIIAYGIIAKYRGDDIVKGYRMARAGIACGWHVMSLSSSHSPSSFHLKTTTYIYENEQRRGENKNT